MSKVDKMHKMQENKKLVFIVEDPQLKTCVNFDREPPWPIYRLRCTSFQNTIVLTIQRLAANVSVVWDGLLDAYKSFGENVAAQTGLPL